MSFAQTLFYLFSAIIIFAALRVVTVRNPIHAALYLVLTFFTTAALWILLEAEFLAITLVLVYVGAVMVLFLFVIMMLDIDLAVMREGFVRSLPVAGLVALVMLAIMVMVVGPQHFGMALYPAVTPHAADYSNTRELGRLLYTVYLYPFEIAAVILLVAIVAAIALTLRQRKDSRYQQVELQVAVERNDRLRIVSMPAEEPRP
ncbi:MAG: NADH-quinone oxidoreductase subunit J [Gammaproteobacteria bacterium]|nr:NADH-quinone oxidoreductase subunit J [Gammaproteobacteria bacterium]